MRSWVGLLAMAATALALSCDLSAAQSGPSRIERQRADQVRTERTRTRAARVTNARAINTRATNARVAPAPSATYDVAGIRLHRPRTDPGVRAAGLAVGVASTVGYLSLNDWELFSRSNTQRANGFTTGGAVIATTIGCIVLSPMVATILVQRHLTHREVHVMAASCVIPIIGGWLMDAAYEANPHWEPENERRR